jgi:hypothetical protein
MPKVKRLDKILDVSEAALSSYFKNGFDQINEDGEVIQRAQVDVRFFSLSTIKQWIVSKN